MPGHRVDSGGNDRVWVCSPVDITEKRGEPRKNLKKAELGIIRKQIFHRITYPKSSKIHLGETFLWPI